MWSFGTGSMPLRVTRGRIAESAGPGGGLHTPVGAPPLVGPGTTGLARGARCSAGDTAVASPTGGEVALARRPLGSTHEWARAVDGPRVRRRIGVLPGRALSWVRGTRRAARRRAHLLRRLGALHRRWRTAGGRRGAGPAGPGSRFGRVAGGDDPVRRHALLQRHDVPCAAD